MPEGVTAMQGRTVVASCNGYAREDGGGEALVVRDRELDGRDRAPLAVVEVRVGPQVFVLRVDGGGHHSAD